THTLSSAALTLTACGCIPWIIGHPRVWAKGCLSGAIFLTATLPWVIYSGLATHVDRIPKARELMQLPYDLIGFIVERWETATLFALIALAVVLVGWLLSTRRPELEPLTRRTTLTLAVMAGWMVVAYGTFIWLMPAASFYWRRMTMTLEAPGVIALAVGFGYLGRAITPRWASLTATICMAGYLLGTGRMTHLYRQSYDSLVGIEPAIEELRRSDFTPDTLFFGTPNFHLTWTYYTGLPVQSVAPVRASYLQEYAGPIVLLEHYMDYATPSDEEFERRARDAGFDPLPEDIDAWRSQLQAALHANAWQARVASVELKQVLPAFVQQIFDETRRRAPASHSPKWVENECPVMLRGFCVRTYHDLWVTYFYRFVDPESRLHFANLASRLPNSTMEIVAGGVAMFRIPPQEKLASTTVSSFHEDAASQRRHPAK
ncbi:MAG: hypothetical protein KDA61_15825, partial [Planctomycetales bacterium]|nr:hypothetical protein [Planctomycetales bacterium]